MVKYMTSNLKIITANLHEQDIKIIAKFIEYGIAASRSDYIRQAVRAQIKADYKYIEKTNAILDGKFKEEDFVKVPGYNKIYRIVRRLEK